VGRDGTLYAEMELVDGCVQWIWPLDAADVRLARALATEHAGLGARDLVHMASCQRREISRLMTFDRALAAAWDK